MTNASEVQTSPAHELPLSNRVAVLRRHPPFGDMGQADVVFFAERAREQHFLPGDVLIRPEDGPASELHLILTGAVVGKRGLSEIAGGAFEYEAGDMFPVSAVLAGRSTTTAYSATQPTQVLTISAADMHELARRSVLFGDFLSRRILRFLELSRAALQSAYASRAQVSQSLETPLALCCGHSPYTCSPETPLREALETMHQRRIGSVLVTDGEGHPLGIFTRYDILGRVVLSGIGLEAPVSEVMVSPVVALTEHHTAQDAVLSMSQHAIRHVPVTRDGRVIGIVSERDLFALHRLNLRHVSASIREANDVPALKRAAQEIRRFAEHLLGQGVDANQVTRTLSHLNDVLTARLIQLVAHDFGVAEDSFCWLSLGSEGRSEQTVATDQDNALILSPHVGSLADRAMLLRFARAVNEALNDCGYPLCPGNIMASNPECCLTLEEWRQRFVRWVDQGSPHDLLSASIFFDFRPLAGRVDWAGELRGAVAERTRANPRFLRQLAMNGLRHQAPLNWLGQIDTTDVRGHKTLDLKLQGTAIFVDVARVYALSQGVTATGTRERLEAVGQALAVPEREVQAWVRGFEFLQILRLRNQLDVFRPEAGNPNRMDVGRLNDIDRRILKEALRVARSLQQRLKLDYER